MLTPDQQDILDALVSEAKAMGAFPIHVRCGSRRGWPANTLIHRVQLRWGQLVIERQSDDFETAILAGFEHLFQVAAEVREKQERSLPRGGSALRLVASTPEPSNSTRATIVAMPALPPVDEGVYREAEGPGRAPAQSTTVRRGENVVVSKAVVLGKKHTA